MVRPYHGNRTCHQLERSGNRKGGRRGWKWTDMNVMNASGTDEASNDKQEEVKPNCHEYYEVRAQGAYTRDSGTFVYDDSRCAFSGWRSQNLQVLQCSSRLFSVLSLHRIGVGINDTLIGRAGLLWLLLDGEILP